MFVELEQKNNVKLMHTEIDYIFLFLNELVFLEVDSSLYEFNT